MSEPILITGIGIVSAIGLDRAETLASLRAERTGVSALRFLKTDHHEFPVGEVPLSTDEMAERMGIPEGQPRTRTALMGMMALQQALKEARLEASDMARAAFVSGTTVGGMDMSEQFYLDFLNNDLHNDYISQHDCGACTESIADHFGPFASVSTLSTACSSAANAMINGANDLRCGRHEIAVVGGSECITKFHLNGFNSLMILDHEQCRPFDETRAGLNLGEGAAFLVLETEASARRRGVKPLGVLEGYGNACDAFHQTASSPDGEGSYRAMKEALADAGLTPADIDYVNAHGTGTPNNDSSESQAMMRLFGADMPPVSSTKSFTGHTTSASGSIEAVICLLALQEQFLPVNLGWQHQMPDGITPVTDPHPQRPLRHVLCNSFGFGGNDSSLVLALPTDTEPAASDKQVTEKQATANIPVYITAAEQISIQKGLCEEWIENPIRYEEPYVRSLDVDFKQWFTPSESRRMGKLLKRALATSLTAMQKSGTEHPDAVITGTGLGCIENTEILLTHLCEEGEENCKPTPFMQSTHNTISSLVSIHTRSHGYNATYAHKEASFDCALEDAWLQMQLRCIQTALVGGQDEMTPKYFGLLCKTGYLGHPGQTAGEAAVSVMLDTNASEKALCRLTYFKRCYRPTQDLLAQVAAEIGKVSAVMTAVTGQVHPDSPMLRTAATLFPDTPLLQFKNLFGESYTAYGLGLYATAQVLHHQQLPEDMLIPGCGQPTALSRILVLNQINDKDYTFAVLEAL
ncbi:MAG: beta-ketoacyl-[acyl-carrier-protein] synthase family protein [Bacteroidales bacterium]|nr:beta-ketoacyl-[acyl-carrier-protein] synthase family protein [Bacteroidales bacterium]